MSVAATTRERDLGAAEPRRWLHVAEQAARAAGEFLVQARMSRVSVVAELERDVKLQVDRQSEEHILGILMAQSKLAILTEERGLVEARGDSRGLRWIVDPLDGSLNYLRGIPLCCVSIGLWRGDAPVLGVVYDFMSREMFAGVVGIGAWLNGTPIRVGDTSERRQAVLCTGLPAGTDFSPSALAQFVEQIRQYRKVRLLGSAALSLAYVAAARADAYYERDIKVWDVAAGLAIVRAAGGVLIRTASAAREAVSVYAGAPALPPPNRMQGVSPLS